MMAVMNFTSAAGTDGPRVEVAIESSGAVLAVLLVASQSFNFIASVAECLPREDK